MIKRNKNGRRPISCEPLEGRRMYVTYQVTGTSGADAISISIDEANHKIISAVNGVSDSASDIINNNIQIDGLGGNDTISITETGSNTVVVNAGAGDDSINVGNGANNLDFVQGAVTVHGDGNTDTVVLFDQSNIGAVTYNFSGGSTVDRVGMSDVITDVESVDLRVSTVSASALEFLDPSAADVSISDALQHVTEIQLDGLGTRSATYRPDGATTTKGSITWGSSSITFPHADVVSFNDMATATLETPKANDAITITGIAPTSRVNGSSGGVTFAPLLIESATTLSLDLANHDGGAGNDTVSGSVGHFGAAVVLINAGTGTNTFTATGGTWTIATATGIGGVNLDVAATGAATNVTLNGSQSIHRVQIDNSATVSTTPVASIMLHQLVVASGNGTLSLGTTSAVIVPSFGTFSIGAGRKLTKTGPGSLDISCAQTHSTGAILDNRAGFTNLFTDAGSTTARPLNVVGSGGSINFGATQHVNSVSADVAYISMLANGNRVLVTNAVSTGSEGGALNLNDNDMIVDYASAAEAAHVRDLLASGYSNGSWDGLGINSKTAELNPTGNTALGNLEGSEWIDMYGVATKFDGQSVDSTSVLVKYTYYGDVDFNGSVDASDYNLIDFGFVNHLTSWSFGDVDRNGTVDVADYNLIDFAFSTQTAVL